MPYKETTVESVLGLVAEHVPKSDTKKLESVKPGSPESFYMLATYCFDLSRKLQYVCKVTCPSADQIPSEVAQEIHRDNEAINAEGLGWQERAEVAEEIMLRLYRQIAKDRHPAEAGR